MRARLVVRTALVAAVAFGTAWGVTGAATAVGPTGVAHAGAAGVSALEEARQPRPTNTPGGQTPTATRVPLFPPTATPTQVRPDYAPGGLFETKVDPDTRAEPSGKPAAGPASEFIPAAATLVSTPGPQDFIWTDLEVTPRAEAERDPVGTAIVLEPIVLSPSLVCCRTEPDAGTGEEAVR